MFWGSPAVAEFRRRYQVWPLPARPHVLDGLLASFAEWAGNSSSKPKIAIVDWRDVPTVVEFELFQRFFIENGYECRIVDPRDIEYTSGTLRCGAYAFTASRSERDSSTTLLAR